MIRPISALVTIFLGVLLPSASMAPLAPRSSDESPRPVTDNERSADRPLVRLVSPAKGDAYVLSNGESRLVIVLEIVDVGGSGIVSDDSGTPRFLDPEPNVRLFVDHLVSKSRYVNGSNQQVIQLVSSVPVGKMVPEKRWSVTAPVDWKRVPPEWRKHISFPPGPVVPFAAFNFRVKDERGVLSADEKPDYPSLVVGFAESAYVPEGTPPPEE